ncbi:phage portal protein [Virgibacillus sp. AGTR]|uniref:phage portal protein n=1 Tax=Virgibacillus sp. AGTR TaxID=2812055 RepID=UPI001D16B6A2|nr:phage portal protein [Virgibacillus sp. AGTR]MCC2248851.1 phage portal protein [Virgibacillus sp. AGTR]
MGIFYNQTETRGFTQEEADVLISMLPGFSGVGTNFTSAKAIENSDVFTVVNLLASDVASLDIEFERNGITDKSDLTELLNINPNGFYSGSTLKFILAANALLNGESFCEIVRGDKQKVIALYHLSNSRVTVRQDSTTNYNLVYEVSDENGKIRRLQRTDILHFKFFTIDGINGVSPLKALKDDLSMQKDSKRFLANFFKNDTQTGGMLKMKQGKLSKEAREKIKKEWQEANAGVENSHKVLVIDDTFDYEPIEVDTEILKLINASTYSTETIGKVYRIPRHKLGLETSNMSLAQANLDYLTSTLNSYLKVITNELNFKLTSNSNALFKFDTAPFKTVDVETHTKLTIEKFDKGLISFDEARKALGDKPLNNAHGKKHLVSLNYTTLDQLEEYQMAKAKSKGGGANEDGGDS